ncbi:MAG: diacylglycerol kinase [Bacillota bacterium]
MRPSKLIDTFNHAIAGLIHSIRTQRNMKIHLFVTLVVLSFSLLFNVSRVELALVIVSISFVIFAELINTAVEVIIDMAAPEYSYQARIAKNISAAAVLVAAGNAVFTGYLIFFDKLEKLSLSLIFVLRHQPIHLAFINIVFLFVFVIVLKAMVKRGTPLKGGIISGHTAIASSAVIIIAFLTHNFLAVTLAMLLAILTAQSRLESGTHSLWEIILGAAVGITVSILIFAFFR